MLRRPGIANLGTLTLVNSTVSSNGATSASVVDPCIDGRLNCHHGDWLAVVYPGEDDQGGMSIDIYCVDLAGKGYFGMEVT